MIKKFNNFDDFSSVQIKKNTNKDKKMKSARKGMSTLELGLVMAIVVIFIAGAIVAYKKLYIPSMGDAAFKQVSSVVSAIERTKMSNDYAFPVANAAKFSAVPLVLNELGGINNARDVANWTYDCTAGSGKTITIVTSAFQDSTIASIAASRANSTLRPWVAVSAGSVVTITLSNVVCN